MSRSGRLFGVLKEPGLVGSRSNSEPHLLSPKLPYSSRANVTARSGPTLSTWALQQVGGYPGYTGRDANIVAQATLDPKGTSDMTGARHAQHMLTGRGP